MLDFLASDDDTLTRQTVRDSLVAGVRPERIEALPVEGGGLAALVGLSCVFAAVLGTPVALFSGLPLLAGAAFVGPMIALVFVTDASRPPTPYEVAARHVLIADVCTTMKGDADRIAQIANAGAAA